MKTKSTQPSTSTYDDIWGPQTQATGPELSLETGTTADAMDVDSTFVSLLS